MRGLHLVVRKGDRIYDKSKRYGEYMDSRKCREGKICVTKAFQQAAGGKDYCIYRHPRRYHRKHSVVGGKPVGGMGKQLQHHAGKHPPSACDRDIPSHKHTSLTASPGKAERTFLLSNKNLCDTARLFLTLGCLAVSFISCPNRPGNLMKNFFAICKKVIQSMFFRGSE